MNETATELAQAPKSLAINAPRKTRATRHRGGWLKWPVTLAVLAVGMWAGLRYWNRASTGQMEYKTSPVTRGEVTQIVTANGSLNPVQLVEVGSQISGVITEIKADFNSRVKAGEVI